MLASGGGVWHGGYVFSKGCIVAFDFITDLRKRIDAGDEAIYEITVHRVKCSIATRHLRGIKRDTSQRQQLRTAQKLRTLRPVVDEGRFFHRRFLFWKELDRKTLQERKQKKSALGFKKSAKVCGSRLNKGEAYRGAVRPS
ncbi:unnamed protein product [Toxocara canis]|uniref:40S ribosomal protein S24 n=1 Tax=Toxocara canis TaxID=6265 RepID=A0A183UTC1_TOXCA|nr:unnamed protein product [Toxocara canis]